MIYRMPGLYFEFFCKINIFTACWLRWTINFWFTCIKKMKVQNLLAPLARVFERYHAAAFSLAVIWSHAFQASAMQGYSENSSFTEIKSLLGTGSIDPAQFSTHLALVWTAFTKNQVKLKLAAAGRHARAGSHGNLFLRVYTILEDAQNRKQGLTIQRKNRYIIHLLLSLLL